MYVVIVDTDDYRGSAFGPFEKKEDAQAFEDRVIADLDEGDEDGDARLTFILNPETYIAEA